MSFARQWRPPRLCSSSLSRGVLVFKAAVRFEHADPICTGRRAQSVQMLHFHSASLLDTLPFD